jgi:hypothetical protein
MTRLFKLPTGVSDQFTDAYLNPATLSFAGKIKNADGTEVPVLYLSSGMKLAVSDEMFTDVINSCDITLAGEIPKGIKESFAPWPRFSED